MHCLFLPDLILEQAGLVSESLSIRRNTEDPRYNDNVCNQRFCCTIEFAV